MKTPDGNILFMIKPMIGSYTIQLYPAMEIMVTISAIT